MDKSEESKSGNGVQKINGETEFFSQSGVDEWQNYSLPTFLKPLKSEVIFNTETGLLYRCLPDRTHAMTNAQVVNYPRKD